MDKNKLNDALKNIDAESLNKVKEAISGKDLGEILKGIDIKKASKALKDFNIDAKELGGILSNIKNNPEVLNEVKNKLK